MGKEEIKNSGIEIGHAFKTFGKTFVRSAETTSGKVSDWANGREPAPAEPNSSVYADGSWKKTGKELGGAFLDMGKSLVDTVTGEDKKGENYSSVTGNPFDSEPKHENSTKEPQS